MPSVESQGIRIHYRVHGEGAPVVLLHSFLCSGAMWESQIEPLAERFRVINIDMRGHGDSGPIAQPLTLYDLVADVIAVLDELEVAEAAWAGLSIGGMIALRAALREPHRVSSLLLLDTDAGSEKAPIRLKYRALGWIARRFGLGPVSPQVSRQMFGRTTRRERRELVSEWAGRFRSVDIPSILIVLDALIARDDVLHELHRIEAPALVVVGSEDASLPPARSRAIADRLPNAEIIEIEGAGHLSTLEQPAAVNRALLGFLDQRS